MNTSLTDLHPHAQSLALTSLRGHCDAVGRDYDSIGKSWSAEAVVVAETEAEARRIAAASPYNRDAILGTPEQVAEQ
ncbi:MAG: hypothetical protein HY328_12890 [Chloroflexi bacterium]|nr:hypothetical protein [Chloroflexota bacterium]